MKVALVGTGPSAAFAVQACKDTPGVELVIFSTHPPLEGDGIGTFYIHAIPGSLIDRGLETHEIFVEGRGDRRQYQALQWPNKEVYWGVPSSFEDELTIVDAYRPSEVLEAIWEQVDVNIIEYPFSHADLRDLGRAFDLVIHTFPTEIDQELLGEPVTIPIMEAGKNWWWSAFNPHELIEDYNANIVIYNGTGQQKWVRACQLWGKNWVEFSHIFEVPEDDSRLGVSKFHFSRDFPPDVKPRDFRHRVAFNVFPLGRFATYNRQELSHHAYIKTKRLLAGEFQDV